MSDDRLARARYVALAWIADIMANDDLRATGMSHPVAMVLAALEGETDPVHCGLSEKWRAGFLALPVADEVPDGQ